MQRDILGGIVASRDFQAEESRFYLGRGRSEEESGHEVVALLPPGCLIERDDDNKERYERRWRWKAGNVSANFDPTRVKSRWKNEWKVGASCRRRSMLRRNLKKSPSIRAR